MAARVSRFVPTNWFLQEKMTQNALCVGAIFFYRRSLKATLQNAPQDEEDGSVRIVIPLTCIARQVHKPYANKLNLVSLFVKCPSPLLQDHVAPYRYNGGGSSATPDLQLVQFAMLENIGSWTEIARIIDQSQARLDSEDPYAQARHVVVDYGSLGYDAVKKIYGGGDTERDHEQFVCDILGITYTPDVWGEFCNTVFKVCIDVSLTSCQSTSAAFGDMLRVFGCLAEVGWLLEQILDFGRSTVSYTIFNGAGCSPHRTQNSLRIPGIHFPVRHPRTYKP